MAQERAESEAEIEPNPFFPVGDYTSGRDTRTHLSGDWDGARTRLARKGLLIHGEGTVVAQSVVSGGRDEESENLFKGDLILKLDGERAELWPGFIVSARAEARGGESVNSQAGTILPVDTAALFPADDADGDIADVTEFLATQFLSERFAVFVGLIQTLDGDLIPGASGRGVEHFQNLGFTLNPVTLRGVPYSTLGGGLLYIPSENVYGSLVAMDTEESSGHDKLDTDDGTTLSSEWYFQYDVGDLPGGQMIGAVYADSDFVSLDQDLRNFLPRLGGEVETDDTWSLYHNAWQMVATSGEDALGPKGWSVASRLGFSDGDPNPVEWFASLMLGARGVFEGRPLDRFGIGYSYLGLSDAKIVDLLPVGDEQAVEAYYSYAVAPAMHVTANVQYVDTGLERQDDAWVAGVRLFFRF